MKTNKKPAKKRGTRQAVTVRPLHKRLALHPFSVMVLLCVGVILAGSTWSGFASSSYDVTARFDAQLPAGPATIASPTDHLHVTDETADVSGTCPPASYVVLYRGGQPAGTAPCVNNAFQVQVGLQLGANILQAKVYNTTNQEGPGSSAVTVYRDPLPATPAVPLDVPLTLVIESIERSSYAPQQTPRVSESPTISGWAPPFSELTLTYYSEPSVCKTKADASGFWTCTLGNALPSGTHHVEIVATTPEGIRLTYPRFEIIVLGQLPSLIEERRILLPAIDFDFRYQTHYIGQSFDWKLAMNGGKPPFKITVNWGDGSESIFMQPDNKPFTITHAFPRNQMYTVFVKSVDAEGTVAILQLFAIIKGDDGTVAATTEPGPIVPLLASVQRYLWIVWPAYIVVLLMVFSYWLGEKEMSLKVRGRQLAGPGGSKGRRV